MASMKDAQNKDKVPTDIWGDNLMLHYVGKLQPGTDSADENEPSFGYTLRRGHAGGGQIRRRRR